MHTQHGHLQVLTPAEINEVLDRGWHAHLACRHWRELYLVPLTYVHDGGFLYCHTLSGKKIKMMRSNPHVCLQVEEVKGVFRWRSIMIWGRFEELKGIEAAKCMSLLSKRISELEKESGLSPVEDEISAVLSSAIFYRVRIETATGRAEGFETVTKSEAHVKFDHVAYSGSVAAH